MIKNVKLVLVEDGGVARGDRLARRADPAPGRRGGDRDADRRLDSRRVGRPRSPVFPPHSRVVEPHPIARVVADELAPILVKLTRAVVREELLASSKAGEDDAADPWVPHSRWPFCSSRRAACALARSGAIDGVHKVGAGRGAVWLARRSALENYVLAHGAPVAVAGNVKPANDELTVDSILAAAGRRRRGER